MCWAEPSRGLSEDVDDHLALLINVGTHATVNVCAKVWVCPRVGFRSFYPFCNSIDMDVSTAESESLEQLDFADSLPIFHIVFSFFVVKQ